MSWNYRIIKHDTDDNRDHHCYCLHEVYYNTDGKPTAWTENPISFACDLSEGPEGIQESLKLALSDALARPVLSLFEIESQLDSEAKSC